MVQNKKVVERNEVVGSFLRTQKIKEAREKLAEGKLFVEDLVATEDKEIKDLVQKQIDSGLKILSDGEFRRSYWHLDFFWGLNGVEHVQLDEGYVFHDEETRPDSARLSGKVAFNEEHPVFKEFTFLQDIAEEGYEVRQSIPAPAQLYVELVRGENEAFVDKFYENRRDLLTDISKAYKETILKLRELGLRHLKFDDCTWGLLVDEEFTQKLQLTDEGIHDLQELYLTVNNDTLEGLPEDLSISTHVCRGNFHSTWAFQGGYEKVAKTLFEKENVEAFFLEFDDKRSGGFEPLRYIPEGKKVVLGLLTSKDPILEDKEKIKERIYEAAEYVPLENLSLSPQCGFASTEEGNKVTEEDQWKKLQLIQEISEEVWGQSV